jgi:hypothetical protein
MRLTHGPNHGAFFHEYFLRDQPHLVAQMFCKNARAMLAMASDVADKKHPAMLPTDFAKNLVPRAYIDPSAQMLPPNKSSSLSAPPSLAESATYVSMNDPREMQELETIKALLVDRALKLRQAQKSRQDRFLHVQRAMVVSLQQHHWQQEHEWYHSFLNSGARHGDSCRRGPNHYRASAA